MKYADLMNKPLIDIQVIETQPAFVLLKFMDDSSVSLFLDGKHKNIDYHTTFFSFQDLIGKQIKEVTSKEKWGINVELDLRFDDNHSFYFDVYWVQKPRVDPCSRDK